MQWAHTPKAALCRRGLAAQLGMIRCYSFVRSTGAFTYKGLRQCCTINRQRRNLAHGVARSVIVSRLFVLHQVDWNSLVLDRLPRQCWEERGKMERWKRNEKKEGKEKCAAKNQQKAKTQVEGGKFEANACVRKQGMSGHTLLRKSDWKATGITRIDFFEML